MTQWKCEPLSFHAQRILPALLPTAFVSNDKLVRWPFSRKKVSLFGVLGIALHIRHRELFVNDITIKSADINFTVSLWSELMTIVARLDSAAPPSSCIVAYYVHENVSTSTIQFNSIQMNDVSSSTTDHCPHAKREKKKEIIKLNELGGYTRIHREIVVFVRKSRTRYFNSMFAEQYWKSMAAAAAAAATTTAVIMKYFSFSFVQWIEKENNNEKKNGIQIGRQQFQQTLAHKITLVLSDRMQKKTRNNYKWVECRQSWHAYTPSGRTFYNYLLTIILFKPTKSHDIELAVFFFEQTIILRMQAICCSFYEILVGKQKQPAARNAWTLVDRLHWFSFLYRRFFLFAAP